MDGLLDYANIFTFWMNQLALFWEFLQLRIDFAFLESILSLRNFFAVLPLPQVVDSFLDALEAAFLILLEVFGIQELSVLGFFFSMMGIGFAVFFIITMVQWLLKTIPVL